MSVRTTASTAGITTTTNLPSPAIAQTWLGLARLNALGGGFQTLAALEDATSNAVGYVSLGWLPSGNLALDVQTLSGYTDFGSGPAAGRWFDWFLQVDTVPATDVWRAGWRYAGYGGVWNIGATRDVSLSWTPAIFQLGKNSYAEWGNISYGRTLLWLATLTLAEIERQTVQAAPVRRANLQRFWRLRDTGDLRDQSGNAYGATAAGTLATDAEPPLPWIAPRPWFVAWAAAGGSAQNITGVLARATGRALAVTAASGAVIQGAAVRSAARAPAAILSAGAVTVQGSAARSAGRGRGAVVFPRAVLPEGALTNNPSNPLISNGPETYDALKAGPRHVIKFGSTDYRMIYEAIANDGLTTTVAAYATSTNGTTWTKQGVVLSASEAWEGPEVAPTTWFWDAAISKYVLYYHGGGNAVPRKIGRATADSPAGPWTKYAGNPVLSPGASGSYDYGATGDCKVVKIGSTYHMWYAGENGTGGYTKIHHATSSDGIAWTKDAANPVFSAAVSGWDSGDVQSPSVVYDAARGLYHLWYAGDNGDNANEALGYAWSTDGVTWTRGANNPVLTKPGGANIYIGDTTDAYLDGSNYRVLYGYFDLNGAAKREIREAAIAVAGAQTVAAVAARGDSRARAATATPGAAALGGIAARGTARAPAATLSAGGVVIQGGRAGRSGRALAAVITAGPVAAGGVAARSNGRAYAAVLTPGAITAGGVAARSNGRALAALVLAGGQAIQGGSARGGGRALGGIVTAGAVTVQGVTVRSAARALAASLGAGAMLQGVAARSAARASAGTLQAGAVVIMTGVARSNGRATAVAVTVSATPGQTVTGVTVGNRSRALPVSATPGPVIMVGIVAAGQGRTLAALVAAGPAGLTGVTVRASGRAPAGALTPGPVMVVAVSATSQGRAVVAVILEGSTQYVGGVAAVTVTQAFAAMLWAIPASRIYRIEFEDRSYRIEFEDRTYAVQGE